MFIKKKILTVLLFGLLFGSFSAPPTLAKGNEYKAIVKHLKTRYKAKKVSIPMLWLVRLGVRMVRPAGVQSFSLTMFENLQFSSATLDDEMRRALKNSFSADWSPVFHVRSRDGQQAYMYIREEGKSIKMTLVTIDKTEAAVIRARFNPEKFIEFIDNPKIFGISLDDGNKTEIANRNSKPTGTAVEKK